MTHATAPAQKRATREASFARLAAFAASQGLTLLTKQWYTLRYDYLFRCARGHEFTRVGTVKCLECDFAACAVLTAHAAGRDASGAPSPGTIS